MKKIILGFFLISLTWVELASAQCTPSLPGPYGAISPDTTVNLPHATVGHAYTAIIQLYVPHDTVYLANSVPVTDFTLNSISGMPAGMSYHTTPSSGIFPGGSAGCVEFTADTFPVASEVGVHALSVSITGHVMLGPVPIPIPTTVNGYKIVIDNNTGLELAENSRFSVSQNFPNPCSGQTDVTINSARPGKADIKLVDMLGNSSMTYSVQLSKGKNTFSLPLKNIPPGIYFYTISNGEESLTRRLIISE